MKLLLVRHGATEWSATGQHTGITDIPLTELGLRQAHQAGRGVARLAGDTLSVATIYTSPLQRAMLTAQIVTDRPREDFVITTDLLEYNYGDYEGLTPEEIRGLRPGWDIWRDGCPGGETTVEVGARAKAFLGTIEKHNELVVAFAHGHIIRILAACAVGLEPALGQIFTLNTATLSIIEDVRGKRVIKLWNFDPHLIDGK